MSQKKARTQRKKAADAPPKPEAPKDPRQPMKLDPVTAEDGIRLLTARVNQALESAEMQVVMRNILKGRRMVLNAIGKPEPDLPWGWQLKGFVAGELWLVPTRSEDLKDEASAPIPPHPDQAASATHDEPKANGHAEKTPASKPPLDAKVPAKDSA